MIRFSLFGVRVSIHPSLWLTLAVLGGVFGTASMQHLFGVALFIIAGFLCLLSHEMGHALTGRLLGGGEPEIYLAWLGGDCNNPDTRLTRLQGVLMTLAGPLTSLLTGALGVLLLCAYVGDMRVGGFLALHFMLGQVPAGAWELGSPAALMFFAFLTEVCAWWSVLNLLPIFPLDGGQIMHGLIDSPRRMHGVSLAVACVLTVFFLVLGLWLMALLMVALACLNHRCRSHAPY